jgi:anti-anti-sigma regulatory factor
MARDEEQMIGFDPLAWMDEEEQIEAQVDNKPKSESENNADDKVENEPVENNSKPEQPEVEMEQSKISDHEQDDEITGDAQVVLEAEMNIQKAAELQKLLIDALEQNDQIQINAEAVKTIDTATLQLLVVLKHEAVKLHKEVVITASERFVESANLLGVGEMLEVA